jgi:hypothetical protein
VSRKEVIAGLRYGRAGYRPGLASRRFWQVVHNVGWLAFDRQMVIPWNFYDGPRDTWPLAPLSPTA